MQIYRNLGGSSGVNSYEIGNDFIIIEFERGGKYLYTYISTGSSNIEHMKILAEKGQGLNSFINRNVRKNFASKLN